MRKPFLLDRAAARAGSQAPALASVQSARAETDTADSREPTRAELWLYGVVGGWWWGFGSDTVAYELRAIGDVDEIVVRLDSPGGSAIQGIAIANLLANHPAKVTVVVDGLAASAASQIAVAGDAVIMSPGSQMMLHDARVITDGNAAELRSDADWIDKQSRNYAETYAHRAPAKSADEWREVMLADDGRGTWYTASETVAAGLADNVANLPSLTPPPPTPVVDEGVDDLEAAARISADLSAIPPAVRATWTDRLSATMRRTHEPPNASAVGSTPTEGGTAVAFSDEQITSLRSTLQLEDTADEAAIVAAVDAVVAENLEERTQGNTVPEGQVMIPAARLADLEAGARAGTEAAQALRNKECQELLDANRAKFLPTSRAGWEAEFHRDPDAVRDHFASAPDLIPVSEVGHANESATSEDDALYAQVWGDEKKGA